MNSIKICKQIILLLFLSFFFNICTNGQENTLQIRLIDQKSAFINQAFIKITNKENTVLKEVVAKNQRDFIFHGLKDNIYILEIQAIGFKPLRQKIELKSGENILELKLEIEQVKVDVKVEQDKFDKRLEDAFNRKWTKQEIEALPNNPNAIKNELKRKYGSNLVIRINGFKGGKLPPKEQIDSIKVILSSFDAEFHEVGYTYVDIQTKAGLPEIFGSFDFDLTDARFNARNSFASEKIPEQNKNLNGYLGLPLIKNKTSTGLSFGLSDSYSKNNIIAVVPNRTIENTAISRNRMIFADVGLDQNLNKDTTIHLNYIFTNEKLINSGIGQFNLPETGFSETTGGHSIRFSATGLVGKNFVNEFRASFNTGGALLNSKTKTPAIIVSEAFTIGGAGIDNNNHGQIFNVADNFFFDAGKNSLKFGGEFEFERQRKFSADNTMGKFFFTSLADFQNNKPAVYMQQLGISQTKINQGKLAIFAQDDVRFYRNLQVGIGLRYEAQNNLKDYSNFSPRLSLTYSPGKEGKIIFRAGTGIFYQWFETESLATILNNDGRQASNLIITNPGYPNPFLAGTISNPLAPSIKTKAANLVNPMLYIIKAGFNYSVTENLNVETFYTFERGVHQFRSRDLNAPINGIRLNKEFGIISQLESSGILTRHSLEVKAEGTLFKIFSFDTRYELAKSTNDFGELFELPMNNYNLRLDKGVSSSDQRHNFTGNFNFLLFKELQITPILTIQSPTPYTVTTGRDDNGDTVFNDRPTDVKRNSERGKWLEQVDLRLGWKIPFFSREGKNKTENKESETNIGSGSTKNYSIGVEVTIQNIFNHTNLQNFIGNQLSPFYRQATFAAPARQNHFGLNFNF